MLIERSAVAASTVVTSAAVLLAVLGSLSFPLTLTVLVIVPGVIGLTIIVKTLPGPFGKLPMAQVTIAPERAHPVDADRNVTPDGKRSVSTTPVASNGPLSLTIIVYAKSFPTKAGSGESDSSTDKSVTATEKTSVSVAATLLEEIGSVSLPLTTAVFVILPAAVGVTTMVTVAVVSFAIPPILQVTIVAPRAQLPRVAVAETNVTLLGSLSESVTPEARSGPLFRTATA